MLRSPLALVRTLPVSARGRPPANAMNRPECAKPVFSQRMRRGHSVHTRPPPPLARRPRCSSSAPSSSCAASSSRACSSRSRAPARCDGNSRARPAARAPASLRLLSHAPASAPARPSHHPPSPRPPALRAPPPRNPRAQDDVAALSRGPRPSAAACWDEPRIRKLVVLLFDGRALLTQQTPRHPARPLRSLLALCAGRESPRRRTERHAALSQRILTAPVRPCPPRLRWDLVHAEGGAPPTPLSILVDYARVRPHPLSPLIWHNRPRGARLSTLPSPTRRRRRQPPPPAAAGELHNLPPREVHSRPAHEHPAAPQRHPHGCAAHPFTPLLFSFPPPSPHPPRTNIFTSSV